MWGVSIGVAALVLAVSALSGFQATLLDEVLSRGPLLQVSLGEEHNADAWLAEISNLDGVSSTQVVHSASGWLMKDGRVVASDFVAFGRAVPSWFPGAGGGEPTGVYVSEVLRLRMGLGRGEPIRVVSPRPTLTPFARQMPRARRFDIAGTFDAGRSQEHDSRVAIPLAAARSLFWLGRPQIDVEVAVERVDEVAEALATMLPESVEISTYRDLNRALFFALRLEKVLMFAGVFLIVAVAAQTLVSSLALLVASKQREIGVLGTIGLRPADLANAVVGVGLVLTGLGALIGGTCGALAAFLLDRFEVVRLPADVYIVDAVPFLLRPFEDLSVIFVSTLALAWVAARATGRRVAALRPAEAIRR